MNIRKWLAILVLGCACGDSEMDTPTTANAEEETGDPIEVVPHDPDIQSIWDSACVSNCHEPGGAWPDLDLRSNAAPESLLDVIGIQSEPIEMPLITPGDPDESYLWLKITDTHLDVGGAGDAMPPGSSLSDEEIERIRQWIRST